MIDTIFNQLPGCFIADKLDQKMSFYFSIDECKKTVLLSPQGCSVAEGKTVAEADCICKTSSDFFLRIWNDDYRPGMGDFMSGKIKSNDPFKLKKFLAVFGK